MSLQRSGRGGSRTPARGSATPARGRGAARPAPGGQRGIYVQKPRPDVYVALLGVALGAILIGCLLLALVLNGYEWQTKAASRSTPAPALTACVTVAPIFSTVHL